jgi:hypothetical protein
MVNRPTFPKKHRRFLIAWWAIRHGDPLVRQPGFDRCAELPHDYPRFELDITRLLDRMEKRGTDFANPRTPGTIDLQHNRGETWRLSNVQ